MNSTNNVNLDDSASWMILPELPDDPTIHLYHFTDFSNVPLIEAHQGLWSIEQLIAKNIQPLATGSDALSQQLDIQRGLHRYVHLSLTENPPMAYVAKKQGRLPKPLSIKIDNRVLSLPGVCFSPDTANKNGVPILPMNEFARYIDIVRVNRLRDHYYGELNDIEKRERRAEILIPDHVAFEYLVSSKLF